MTVELLRTVLAVLVVASAGVAAFPEDLRGDPIPSWTDATSEHGGAVARVGVEAAIVAVDQVASEPCLAATVIRSTAAPVWPPTGLDLLDVAPKTSPPPG